MIEDGNTPSHLYQSRTEASKIFRRQPLPNALNTYGVLTPGFMSEKAGER